MIQSIFQKPRESSQLQKIGAVTRWVWVMVEKANKCYYQLCEIFLLRDGSSLPLQGIKDYFSLGHRRHISWRLLENWDGQRERQSASSPRRCPRRRLNSTRGFHNGSLIDEFECLGPRTELQRKRLVYDHQRPRVNICCLQEIHLIASDHEDILTGPDSTQPILIVAQDEFLSWWAGSWQKKVFASLTLPYAVR